MVKSKRRGRGEGSIYQRKDGRWVAEITLEDGKRKPLYAKTQAEAIQKRNEALLRVKQGVVVTTGPKQKLKDFLEYWLEDVHKTNIRFGTYRGYRTILTKHLIPGLGHIQLQKLTTQHIQMFYAKRMREGFTPARIRNINAVLHRALNHAKREKLVASNVADDVERPHVEEHEIEPLTPEQAHMFLQKVRDHHLEALLMLALTTGMRKGEILGLRWKDVDLEKRTLHIRRTLGYAAHVRFYEGEPKTAKSKRKIVLPQLIVESLHRHRTSQKLLKVQAGARWVDRDLVFCNKRGDFIIPETLTNHFNRFLKEVGLPHMRFHDLRHSAATLLLSMGVPMKVVQKILGHSNYGTTANIYGHVLPEMEEDAMTKMDDFFRQQS